MERLGSLLQSFGIDPDYYLKIDFPSDLSYDVYRPGEQDEKLPILLLDSKNTLSEISCKSEIVRSISGIHMGKYHLYYPHELLLNHLQELDADVRILLGLS